MEIVAFVFALAIVAAFQDRKDRQTMYPDGPCDFCYDTVTFDWSIRGWVHASTGLVESPDTFFNGRRAPFSHLARGAHRRLG